MSAEVEVQVVYTGARLPDLGIAPNGWLVYRHPDGQWVTLADLGIATLTAERDELLAKLPLFNLTHEQGVRKLDLERAARTASHAAHDAEQQEHERLLFQDDAISRARYDDDGAEAGDPTNSHSPDRRDR